MGVRAKTIGVACVALLGLGLGCSDEPAGPAPTPDAEEETAQPDAADGTEDADPDGDAGSTDPGDTGPEPDGDAGPEPEVVPDADAGPAPLAMQMTLPGPPEDPLAGGEVEGCPTYLESRCEGGVSQVCAVYDTGTSAFVDDGDVDPLLRRVFLYDRWYELYGSPDGQTGERLFTIETTPEMPEAEWASMDVFAGFAGRGDSAIWTGVALTADIYRYMSTGTQADYQRMVRRLRTLLTKFDVTGIPGYLARYHFLLMPEGGPVTDQHFQRFEGQTTLGHRDHLIVDPSAAQDLPDSYFEGLPDGAGGMVKGTPMWNGHVSIDQNTGPMVAFPLIWPLLQGEEGDALRERMRHHLTCYLNRLERIELTNLQENPTILELLTSYFGGSGGGLQLDPDDIDLTKLDRVVAFAHRGYNSTNAETFDKTCPDGPPMTPSRVYDASDDDFMLNLLDLVADLGEDESQPPRATQLDHFYVPTLRGGDASHMMHLAAMAWWLTEDEQYWSFLQDELIGELQTVDVALTMQAFRVPDFCFKYYGDHITYGTHWQFITMLPDSPLRDAMIRVMHEEMWEKAMYNHKSAKFDVMYASIDHYAPGHPTLTALEQASGEVTSQLQSFGGAGQVIDSPRRTYGIAPGDVLDAMPEGITLRCPTEEEVAMCENNEIFGLKVGNDLPRYPCDGRPGECDLGEGECTAGIASDGLPPRLRKYADFMWQRSPFQIGEAGNGGRKQSPGRDLSEPYWMARYYGLIGEGAGQVLAWRDGAGCGE